MAEVPTSKRPKEQLSYVSQPDINLDTSVASYNGIVASTWKTFKIADNEKPIITTNDILVYTRATLGEIRHHVLDARTGDEISKIITLKNLTRGGVLSFRSFCLLSKYCKRTILPGEASLNSGRSYGTLILRALIDHYRLTHGVQLVTVSWLPREHGYRSNAAKFFMEKFGFKKNKHERLILKLK